MPRRNNQSNPEAVETALKQARAIKLRTQGYTLEQIAAKLGYAGKSGAYHAIKAGIKKACFEVSTDLRAVQNARYERLLKELWPLCITEDPTEETEARPNLQAIDRLLRVMDQFERLNGLVVNKVAPTNLDGTEYKPFSPGAEFTANIFAVLAEARIIQPVEAEPDQTDTYTTD